MRVGFKTSLQGTTWTELLAVWREADQADLIESGWTYDHFVGLSAGPGGIEMDHQVPVLEGWTVLTALAAVTNRLRIGNLVTGVHFRHPAVLTKMACTVDVISCGRLELGIGAGWLEEECDVFGFEPLGPPGRRASRLEEAVDVVLGLMTNERFSYDGRYYRLREASSRPAPLQHPHPPLWLGGNGPRRTLPLVARLAQAWNYTTLRPGAGKEDFQSKVDALQEECARIGRPFREVTVSVQVPFSDDPVAFADRIAGWRQAGAGYVIVMLPLPHHPRQIAALHEGLVTVR